MWEFHVCLGLIPFSKLLSYKTSVLGLCSIKTNPRVRFKVVFGGPLDTWSGEKPNCIVTGMTNEINIETKMKN